MPRPCHQEHSLQPQNCRVCHWCADDSPRGEFYRRLWGEPEPNGGQPRHQPLDRREFHRILREQFIEKMPPYPEGQFAGRGALILGGGKYEASVYVAIQMLRSCGWKHPIEVWFRSHEEYLSPRIRRLPGVAVIDATELLQKAHRRSFSGWETKTFATIHSRFEEILYLDADAYPVRNPEFCFDYLQSGLMVWPDGIYGDSLIDFSGYDLPHDGKIAINGGHYVLRKRQAWSVLQLANWFDNYSDYYYLCGCGDQDAMRAAIARLGYVVDRIPRDGEVYHWRCFVQRGPDSPETLFVHRQGNKFALPGEFHHPPEYSPNLPREAEAWQWFQDWMSQKP